ncbi:MAG TPA: hypothetical protein VFZ66_22535 [Herpetosiphonaceae bacterium]
MTRRQRPKRPYAVLIAPDKALLQQRDALAALGFTVAVSGSLLSGYGLVRHLLAPPQPAQQAVILLDVQSADPGFPDFPGLLLAAVLARQMRLGELPPAWMVGVVTRHMPESEAESLVAGCQRVLHLPVEPDTLSSLAGLARQPPPIPHRDAPPGEARALYTIQMIAQRMLLAVQSARVRTWTPEDVALLLRWLTPYPQPKGATQQVGAGADEARRIESLLRSLGGVRGARQRLETIAEQWQTRHPLHSEIVLKFLDGLERAEIVKYFVRRRLYEDSRVYHCINDLPRRICDQLRRDQVMQQEDWTID